MPHFWPIRTLFAGLLWTTISPLATAQIPTTGPEQVNGAWDLHDGALALTTLLNELRISADTEKAMRAALPDVNVLITKTGADGVLLEARYVRDKTAERYSDLAPVNLTQKLIGDRVNVIGAGQDPKSVMVMSMSSKELSNGSPGRDGEPVKSSERDFWVTRGGDRKPHIAEINHKDLVVSARAVFLDKARFEQFRLSAYRNALSGTLKAVEYDGSGKELREEATALLVKRNEALRRLDEIDKALGDKLDAAKRANRAADSFAIAQTLLGGGSAILSGYEKSADAKGTQEQLTTPKPSETVMTLIRERIKIEGDVTQSDISVMQFSQRNGRSPTVQPVQPKD